jgi:hypothetical protein
VLETNGHVDHEREDLGGALRFDLSLAPLELHQPADVLVTRRCQAELPAANDERARDVGGGRVRPGERGESLRESPIEWGAATGT